MRGTSTVFASPTPSPFTSPSYAIMFCLPRSSAGESSGFVEYAQYEEKLINAFINILVFKMLSTCGISRMFDDFVSGATIKTSF